MGRILEGRNRATPSEAASFVDEHIRLEKEMETLRMTTLSELAKKLAPLQKQVKENLEDAKKNGVNKGVVKAIASARKFEEKARKAVADLDDDDQTFLKDIRTALGDFKDLPLGAAAVDREDAQDETTAAVIGAVQADMTDEERAAADGREWDEAEPA